MAIKINGCTVIDDSKNWLGNPLTQASPSVASCKVCGLTTTSINLSCANYYKYRLTDNASITCICNIGCCQSLFFDVMSNDGSQLLNTLPGCFTKRSPLVDSKNRKTIYRADNIGDEWTYEPLYTEAYLGDNINYPYASSCAVCARTSETCLFCIMASTIPWNNDNCSSRPRHAMCPGNCGTSRVDPTFVFTYQDNAVAAFTSLAICNNLCCICGSCSRISFVAIPENYPSIISPYSSIGHINIPAAMCFCGEGCINTAGTVALLGVSKEKDFFLITRPSNVSYQCPNFYCSAIEAYSLSSAIEKCQALLLQSYEFQNCCYCRTSTVASGNKDYATFEKNGGYENSFNFDNCSGPLVVSGASCAGSDGMKIWLGSTPSCLFCYCHFTSGFGFGSATSLRMSKNSKYVLNQVSVRSGSFYDARHCLYYSIYRDTFHNCCTCVNFTQMFAAGTSYCPCCCGATGFNRAVIFDCCLCHFGVFTFSSCSCMSGGWGQNFMFSRKTDDTGYVASLTCCDFSCPLNAPYMCGCRTDCSPVTFGIKNENCCWYSVTLRSGPCACGAGCGARYCQNTCTWSITTTAVDISGCFTADSISFNPHTLYVNAFDADGGVKNPLTNHELTESKLFSL